MILPILKLSFLEMDGEWGATSLRLGVLDCYASGTTRTRAKVRPSATRMVVFFVSIDVRSPLLLPSPFGIRNAYVMQTFFLLVRAPLGPAA
jgi:hypothetical protein